MNEQVNDTLVYRCPHCGATVAVPESLVGDAVDCPNCRKIFTPPMPLADRIDDLAPTAAEFALRPGRSDTESTLAEVHPSLWRNRPVSFFGLVAATVGGLVVLVLGLTGGISVGEDTEVSRNVAVVMGGIIGLLAAATLGYWLLIYLRTTLIITTKRTVYRWGVLSRSTTEVKHKDVRNIQVEQSFIDRLLSVGDVAMSSAGQDDLEIRAYGIAHPNDLAEVIRDYQ